MNDPAAPSVKARLRSEALSRRDRLTAVARARASAEIAGRALAIVAAEAPGRLAGYMPIRSEADPRPLLEGAAAEGVALCLPAVIDSTSIAFRAWRIGDVLVPGGFGTQAPARDQAVVQPELVILPLVAFDRRGVRLGYGRGFYDRALAGLRRQGLDPRLVGVAFTVQEVRAIPEEPHDVRLDWIVTESETLDLRR